MPLFRPVRVTAFALVLTACSSSTPSDEPVRATGRPIINGSPASGGVYDSVGALTDQSGFAYCTGTYVGQRRVVTAGHCLQGAPPRFVYFGPDANADAQSCVDGNQTACARFREVQSAQAHPNFNLQQLTNDIAVVVLTAEPGVAAIPMCAQATGTQLGAADEGQPLDFVGFGITNGMTGTGGGTRLQVDGIPLAAVGPDGQIGIDGNQIFYTQPSGGPCSGDSGGPAFIAKNGVPHIAGVTSFGDQNCTEFGVSTRVDPYIAFVLPGGAPPPDAGVPATPDASVPGTPDAGAGETPDAGGGGGGEDGEVEGGCGCRTGGSGRGALGGALVLLGALGLLGGRARRQRRS
jgi:secreted trypsin-like serine protease